MEIIGDLIEVVFGNLPTPQSNENPNGYCLMYLILAIIFGILIYYFK